ncbi:hypothetical protein O9929_10265 [Vibrio lentus]|nr:hypothetical protein [Vibrio lentus]
MTKQNVKPLKKRADNRRKDMKSADGDDAIAAAIARVKAQKATADQDTAADKQICSCCSHCSR